MQEFLTDLGAIWGTLLIAGALLAMLGIYAIAAPVTDWWHKMWKKSFALRVIVKGIVGPFLYLAMCLMVWVLLTTL